MPKEASHAILLGIVPILADDPKGIEILEILEPICGSKARFSKKRQQEHLNKGEACEAGDEVGTTANPSGSAASKGQESYHIPSISPPPQRQPQSARPRSRPCS